MSILISVLTPEVVKRRAAASPGRGTEVLSCSVEPFCDDQLTNVLKEDARGGGAARLWAENGNESVRIEVKERRRSSAFRGRSG